MNIEIKELRRYIEKIATNVLKDETSKTVFSGTIKSSIPGGYEVQLVNAQESSLVLAESLYEEKTYSVNDMVYLVQAESNRRDDYDTKYFIMGLVNKIEQNYANLSDLERFQFLGDRQILTGFDPVQWPHLITDDSFLNAFRANGAMLFSANITSDFTNTANPVNFGFKFTFTFDNDEQDSIYFLQGEFVGQPWHQNNVTQKKLISLGKGNKTKSILMELVGPEEGGFSASNVSLEIGTLLDVAKDFSVSINTTSGKNYFNKSAQPDNENKIIKIKASVKFKQQALDTSLIKYYWFVEDDNITAESFPTEENKYGYNALGGEGWACLNDWVYAEYYNGSAIVEDKKTIIYTTDDNELEVDRKWLTKYENKIKCVIGYNLANAESEPIKIYNFDHEELDIILRASGSPIPMAYKDEYVTLTVNWSSKLVNPTGTYSYKWYRKGAEDTQLSYETINEKGESVTNFYGANLLNIYSNLNKPNIENAYYMATDKEEIYCKAFLGENEVGVSEPFEISSIVSQQYIPIEEESFKYWKSEASNVRFLNKKVSGEIKTPGNETQSGTQVQYTYYYLESGDDQNPEDRGQDTEDAILGTVTDDKKYYIYRSIQKKIYNENDINIGNNRVCYRISDYSYPAIARYVCKTTEGIVDLLTPSGIEKLNTFNELTDGGRAQGIKYDGAVYQISKDETPDKTKLATGKGYYEKIETFEYTKVNITEFEDNVDYYVKDDNENYTKVDSDFDSNQTYYIYKLIKTDYKLRPENSENYEMGSDGPIGFKSGQEYYEQDGGDLYINASYIRSGTLEVGDGEKTIFKATLDATEEAYPVIMAGYKVNETTLQTDDEKVGMSSSKDSPAFWAGEKLVQINHDGSANFGSTQINCKEGGVNYDFYGKDGNFKVTDGGQLHAIDAEIKGKITAEEGSIGGFHIKENHLASGDCDNPDMVDGKEKGPHTVMISSGYKEVDPSDIEKGQFAFWAGEKAEGKDNNSRPFWVSNKGHFKAVQGQIGAFQTTERDVSFMGEKPVQIEKKIQSDESISRIVPVGTFVYSGRDPQNNVAYYYHYNFEFLVSEYYQTELFDENNFRIIDKKYTDYTVQLTSPDIGYHEDMLTFGLIADQTKNSLILSVLCFVPDLYVSENRDGTATLIQQQEYSVILPNSIDAFIYDGELTKIFIMGLLEPERSNDFVVFSGTENEKIPEYYPTAQLKNIYSIFSTTEKQNVIKDISLGNLILSTNIPMENNNEESEPICSETLLKFFDSTIKMGYDTDAIALYSPRIEWNKEKANEVICKFVDEAGNNITGNGFIHFDFNFILKCSIGPKDTTEDILFDYYYTATFSKGKDFNSDLIYNIPFFSFSNDLCIKKVILVNSSDKVSSESSSSKGKLILDNYSTIDLGYLKNLMYYPINQGVGEDSKNLLEVIADLEEAITDLKTRITELEGENQTE